MEDTYLERNKDIICKCSGTTVAQIRRLVDKGVNDLDGVSRATGACSGCGACDMDVLAALAEYSASLARRANLDAGGGAA